MSSEAVILRLPADASDELVEQVKAAFPDATIAVEGATPAPTPLELEAALATAVSASGGLGGVVADWWSGIPGGATSLVLIFVALVAAYAIERGVRVLAARGRADAGGIIGEGAEVTFSSRLEEGGRWLIGRALSLIVFVVAARVIGRVMLPADPGLRDLGLGVLGAIVLGRAVLAVVAALTAPQNPSRRLMGFSDTDAADVFRIGFIVANALILIRLIRALLVDAAGAAPEAQLALIILAVLNSAAGAIFFIAVREPVTRLMVPDTPGIDLAGWRTWLARRWHWAFVGLIVIDVALKIFGILGVLSPDANDGAGPVIFLVMVAALVVSAIATYRRGPDVEDWSGWGLGALVFAEGAVIVGASILLLRLWGIDPLAAPSEGGLGALLPGLVEAGIITVIGIALWRASAALITRNAGGEGDTDDGGDGMGGEGSRLETVVPILRGFAFAVIGVTTAMTALAAMGVNVGPLIASAGVVGLAVGFGAQKLVSDVISGLFYLFEDAFRLGEYIVTDGGKGTVERISIRSARLRHHNGPIYTIPFSAMGTIQNHSRDFVVMKFSFQVPEDTDVEMVRKLVKKAGAELSSDPELEGKLISPLKSQGAVSIQGRSFEIGCKFTARPGQQFLVRRKAYVALQRALRNAGIELFAPTLTLAPGELSGPGNPSGPA
ncbi:MAG: mechanosensitive ion channel domain-containing protein [Pseudomonadota bacterium]